MHTSTVLTTLASMVALASAQSDCYWCNQSAPFNLVVESSNQTYNGALLTSFHSGAAIETFGLSTGEPSASNTYTFNTTATPPSGDYPTTGLLTWLLQGGNFNASSAMTLTPYIFSNVAVPALFPGSTDAQQVAFTTSDGSGGDGGYLALVQSIDDTVVPAAYLTPPVLLQRWYICQNFYGGYRYTSLSWVFGTAAPQNPSCVAAKVRRRFLTKTGTSGSVAA